MKNKILSMILCISLLLSMFSGVTEASETMEYTFLSYSPASFDGYYVFNSKTDIPAVARAYMGGSYVSKFSVNSLIKSVKWNVSADADSTQLSTYVGRASRDRGFAMCYGGDLVPEVLRQSVRKGDMQIAAVMQGYADTHSNFKYHLSKKTTNVVFRLKETFSKVMVEYYSAGQRPAYMGWAVESQRIPVWYKMNTSGYFPYFDFTTAGCGCGGVHFNNISAMLKDTRGPAVTDIFPSSDERGINKRTTYKAGETVYFNVRFNENVRFSDDLPGKDKILKVKKKYIATNMEHTDTIDATYYNLMYGNTMVFKYVVPAEGEDFEFYADSIADWGQQIYLYSDEEKFTYSDQVLSQVDQASIDRYKLDKVTSCIVDIAGNPMEKNASVTAMSSRAYMDNVKPVIQRVEVEAAKGNDNQSGSKTYLKAGDQITATAVFSEEIGVKLTSPFGQVQRQSDIVEPMVAGEMEATLNINNESVNVKSSQVLTGPDGARAGTIVTKVSFPYTIKAGDVLDGERINITDIHFFNVESSQLKHNALGVELTDARGNPFATTENDQVSAQQYELDNDAPIVVIENEPAPTYYQNENNPCEFYYKVNVSDDKSGIIGKNGLFSLDTAHTGESVYQDLQYSISDKADKPSVYKSGKTGEKYSFAELPNGVYIHIKLTGQKSTGGLTLNVTAFDRNDNAAAKTASADKTTGVKIIDILRPEINTTYTIDSGKNYAVTIIATDESTVSKISYQWVTTGGAIDANGWTDVVNSTASSSLTVNLTEATADNSLNEKTLYVKAIDEFGNETGTPADYSFQLDRLAAGAEITVNNFEPTEFKSEHDIKVKILDDNTAVNVRWNKVNPDGSEQGAGGGLNVVSANSIIDNNASDIWITNYASRLAAGVDTFDIAKVNDLAKFSQNSQNVKSYGETLGLFYGTYRVYITAARIIKDADGKDTIVNKTESAYTLKIVGKDTVLQRDVNLTPVLPDGAPPNASLIYDNNYEYNYTGSASDDAVTTNLSSAEGVKIKLDIFTTSPYVEDIGIDYIDFEKSKYQVFKVSYDENWNKVFTPIYEKKLDATNTQYMTILDELLPSSKDYTVKVTLVDKNGNFTEKYINNITIDKRKIVACGPTAVRNGSSEETPIAKYSIEPGQETDAIYIGANGSNVEFTCAAPKNELFGKAFFKLWLEDKKAEETIWCMILSSDSDAIDQNIYSTYSVRYLLPDTDLQLKTGENHLKYQFMFGNGEKSEIKDLKVYMDSVSPEVTLGCDNASVDGKYYRTNQAVVPHIEALYDNLTPNEKLKVRIYAATEDGNGGYEELLPETSGGDTVLDDKGFPVYRFTQNGVYEVSVTDQSGNVTESQMIIDWIDTEKPVLQVSNSAVDTDFGFRVNVSDGSNDAVNADGKSKFTIMMQFDNVYSALPGVNAISGSGEAQWFDITDTAKASFPGKLSINSSVNPDGTATYNLNGEFAFDSNVAEGTAIDRTIRFKAVDAAGNESDIKEVTINKTNAKPAIVQHGLEQGTYAVAFNTTVKLDSVCANPAQIARKHTNIAIYENGTHKIAFSDLFGNKYEATITADIFEKAFEHGIVVSETLPTRNDVTVELNTLITDGLYIIDNMTIKDVSGADISDANVVKTTSADAVAGTVCTGLKISLKSNAMITYTMKNSQTGTSKTCVIPVLNIDKTAPAAHIVYNYEAPIENGKTEGYVTAFLVSDNEEIVVSNGTGMSHLFTVGNGESYTFEFEDLAGNKSSLVAQVDAIINKTYFANDTTPPEYSIILSSMNGKGINKFDELTRTEYEQSIADPNFRLPYLSGRLLVEFDINDINKVTLSLVEPKTSVSVVGNKVVVSDNTQFTVLLTDANNNVTQVNFNINTIDNQAPTGTVKYEALSNKSVRAYLTMTDDISPINKLSVLNTSGVEYDAQKGYYISFVDNGSSSFIISDEAGNISFIPAAVAFIDKNPPNIKTVEWVPFKYTQDNKPLKDQLSDKKFNGNVTAFLLFSKPIKNAELITASEQAKIDLAVSTMSLLVTIKENTAPTTIQIKVTDYSDNVKTVELPTIDIIDKEGPVVLSVNSNPSDASAQYKEVEYTFNLNENAYFTSETFVPALPGEMPQPQNTFTKKITENGQYNLSFTDEAGNITYYTLSVQNRIDKTPPSIMLFDVPATKKMVDDYNKTASTPAIHTLTNQSVAFEVSMSKKGTLSVNSTDYKINANEKIQVVAPYNGIYRIVAEDEVGYITTSIVEIDCIDKVLPKITVPSLQTIEVKKDTTLAGLTATALSGVTALDNCDGDVTAKVALTNVTQNDLKTPGSFYFTYSVTDTAGNTAVVARRVKVFADTGFTVFVNGKLTEKNNLIMVTANSTATGDRLDISTTLNSKLPVKMYYKKGIQTEGTMKTGATAFTGGFNVTKGSYYTIYLQTQDRVNYLTYVYVTE